jgi:hypothetical protein
MYTSFIVVLVAIAIAVALLAYRRKRQSHGTCVNCGAPSDFGYSREPETRAEDIVKLCLTCLAAKMKNDYERYEGRALVIQPASGFPCYVYQTNSRWAGSRLAKESHEMCSGPDETCNQCGAKAQYFWVTSNGLNPANLEQLLSDGLEHTLLQWGNAHAIPLCAGCCVQSITKTIADRRLRFYEVCSPRSEGGFVVPMAY